MRSMLGGRIRADAITLVFSALLAIATIWMLVDLVGGMRNSVANLMFGMALGLLLGDQVRIVASRQAR